MSVENRDWIPKRIMPHQEPGYAGFVDLVEEQIRLSNMIGDAMTDTDANRDIVPGRINYITDMVSLGRNLDWKGSISAEGKNKLTSEQQEEYLRLVPQAVVATQTGGQSGCIDGRTFGRVFKLGPKTAGGTEGDAQNIVLASYAYDERNPISPEKALDIVIEFERVNNFLPGGHGFGQCGRSGFTMDALEIVANKASDLAVGVQAFQGAFGGVEFDDSRHQQISDAAAVILDRHTTPLLKPADATQRIKAVNPDGLPDLLHDHKELALLKFKDMSATIDNDRLSRLTSESTILGNKESGIFPYNWGKHLGIASMLGGELGQLYLHSVPNIDIATLTNLTDGSLGIYAFEPTE